MSTINLSGMAGGAVQERFAEELDKVLENINDPNTDPLKARKITVTVTVKGNEERDMANVDIQAKSTLQPAKALTTRVVFGEDAGKVVGEELLSGQKGQTFLDPDDDMKLKTDTGQPIPENQNVVNMKKSLSNQNIL